MTEVLGKDAAVLMPSGTLAQQIALRCHCERGGVRTVAFHPASHLELREHAGYTHLHGPAFELVGARERLMGLADLEAAHARIGALLIELPQREIGGWLPEWDDLLAPIECARSRGVATHLDGARIWESALHYLRGDRHILWDRMLDQALAHGVWLAITCNRPAHALGAASGVRGDLDARLICRNVQRTRATILRSAEDTDACSGRAISSVAIRFPACGARSRLCRPDLANATQRERAAGLVGRGGDLTLT